MKYCYEHKIEIYITEHVLCISYIPMVIWKTNDKYIINQF